MTYLISTDPILLSPGDRMSRDEFLARWEQMPSLKRAELIDGVVYMPSPVSLPTGVRTICCKGGQPCMFLAVE